jgi:PAXNEB protein
MSSTFQRSKKKNKQQSNLSSNTKLIPDPSSLASSSNPVTTNGSPTSTTLRDESSDASPSGTTSTRSTTITKADTTTTISSTGTTLLLPGTKYGTSVGILFTSTGLRELDMIVTNRSGGGGQPLQTCFLIEEDRWTNDYATCLVKYWCAEVSVVVKATYH